MNDQPLLALLFFFIVGGFAGYAVRMAIALSRKKSIEQKSALITEEAQKEARKIIQTAEDKAEKTKQEIKTEEKELRNVLQQTENRLNKKEENLDKKNAELEQKETNNKKVQTTLEEIKEKLKNKEASITDEIAKVAKLSEEEAKEKLLERIKKTYENDLLLQIQKLEHSNKEALAERAKDIVVNAMERYAASTAQEHTTTTVSISSDDLKGKIIGKEGRNIRAFERIAGVELIIDDTPGAIIISSYDPIRRQVARVALDNLLLDGRIQPAKIEEFVENAKHEINKIIKKEGENAVYELGIIDLDPRVVAILGRLHFRTSYGQNVLQHSIEMAHISGMIAEEIGANVSVAKTGALVHDIGKAVDHEIPGGHIKIGMRLLEKFGTDPKIIDAMKSHHNDFPHASIEAVIVQTADHISGGRPGARRDSVENYLKRLQELENVANSFKGVKKSYALQAGREIRIFVEPNVLSDLEAKNTARDIVQKIEKDLKYPGEIKVTVVRETRIIEFAR